MFGRLTALASRKPRRVVTIGAFLAVAAAILGGNVAQSLGPYGADDPATDSAKSDALEGRGSPAPASPTGAPS
jgi:hypothetical protein